MARRKNGNALTNNRIDSAGSHVTKRLRGLSSVAAFATVPPRLPPFSSMNSMPAAHNTVRIFELAPFHLTGRRYSLGRRSHGVVRVPIPANRGWAVACIHSSRAGFEERGLAKRSPAFRFHVRLDASSFFNVFDVLIIIRHRSYCFFSAALAILSRAAFVVTVGFDALAGSAERIASTRGHGRRCFA